MFNSKGNWRSDSVIGSDDSAIGLGELFVSREEELDFSSSSLPLLFLFSLLNSNNSLDDQFADFALVVLSSPSLNLFHLTHSFPLSSRQLTPTAV